MQCSLNILQTYFQEFGSTALSLVEDDPLTLKEVHEHMIRSPPPTSCWPHDSLTQRAASAFDFGGDGPQLLSSHSVDGQVDQECGRSPRRPRDSSAARARSSSQASPRPRAPSRPLSLPGESHLKLNKKQGGQTSEKFSLLQHPRPLRRRQDDSVRLVADCDK
ncbi:unnamed protein product [Plutella xylostella]|uniref:(diamondback moth) hypothetical protein n=1 Tax=Plutella xylostella TaxID=51655 RepID=A0A8S4FV84_PLUXY|nr:unnamed protein product [Plutella xylostella]